MSASLTHNAYGKSRVRVTKVVRDGGRTVDVYEFDVDVQLEGDFADAYTAGDNRNVIATDSMKNTVYVLAKEQTFDCAERFALILARHFAATYPQVTKATIELTETPWRRIPVYGRGDGNAFEAGGPRRYAKAIATRASSDATIVGGVRGMLVMKTTGSEFRDFVDDRYRTLNDTRDRLMATQIDADWTYCSTEADFAAASRTIESAILTTLSIQHSLGVQQTLMDMGQAALDAVAAIDSITFELPNLHRIPFNFAPFGLQFDNDVYVATDEPRGLIKGTVTRPKD